MYLPADEARSDVILAGAATVFGGIVLSVLLSAPGIPRAGLGADLIVLLGWFALSGLAPLLLARYRDDVPAAFGLSRTHRLDVAAAASLAAPVAVAGVVRGLLIDGSLPIALLGRPGRALLGSPVVGTPGGDAVATVVASAGVVVLTVGALLLLGFLTVRGRDAFRDDPRSTTQLLRTIGVAAAAIALVLGTFRALVGGGSLTTVLLDVGALMGLVLVADRLVAPGSTISRPVVLGPVVLVVAAHVLAAGGIFRGDLLLGLTTGAFAAATALVVAVVAEERGTTAVAVPLLVAVHWWPTCLAPLPFGGC